MAGFGIGFGRGILEGLNRNIERDDTLRLQQAQLTGDIMGLQSELPEEERGALPTGTEPRSGLTSILGAFGLSGNRLPDMEQQITQRAALAAKAKAYQRELAQWKDIAARIEKGEFTPEEEDQLLRQARGPIKLVLPGIIRKARATRAARSKFQGLLTGGVQDRIGSTGAQEEGETATDIITNRPASRSEIAGAAAGIPGLEDDVIREALRREPADPTSLIQPGPGTPASIVNRRTGAVSALPGTERARDPLADLKRRNIESQITKRKQEPKLNQLQMVAAELTARRQGKPAGSAVPEFAGLTNQELEAKVKSNDLRGLLAEILSQGEGGTPVAPTLPRPPVKPAPKSAQIPPGSKQIGTKNGKPVYQTPDGKRIVVD